MSNVHFHFRIAPEELTSIKIAALKLKQSPSEFARDAVFERLGKAGSLATKDGAALAQLIENFDEVTLRLVALDDAVSQLRSTMVAIGQKLEMLGIAAIASSALLIDTSKMQDDAATARVVAHIDEALDVAPGILDRQKELTDSTQA